MGMSALSDIYVQSPRAEGIHIRQSTSAHVTTTMLHFWHSKICPKLDVDISIYLYSDDIYIYACVDLAIIIAIYTFSKTP